MTPEQPRPDFLGLRETWHDMPTIVRVAVVVMAIGYGLKFVQWLAEG